MFSALVVAPAGLGPSDLWRPWDWRRAPTTAGKAIGSFYHAQARAASVASRLGRAGCPGSLDALAPDRDASSVVQRLRASVVCVSEQGLLCVRLRDPETRVPRLYVPGGAIEPGETPAAAAEREALEETGYRVRVELSSELVVRYPFRWAWRDVDCTTHFFRAALLDQAAPPASVLDAEIEAVQWLPLSRLAEELGFDRFIFSAVHALATR